MPLYKVRCDRCGRVDEILRLASNAWEVLHDYGEPCPVANCGGRMWPVPAASSFVLKGDGWPGKQSNPARNVEENKTYPAEKSNQEV